jgi:hypothetical protein
MKNMRAALLRTAAMTVVAFAICWPLVEAVPVVLVQIGLVWFCADRFLEFIQSRPRAPKELEVPEGDEAHR